MDFFFSKQANLISNRIEDSKNIFFANHHILIIQIPLLTYQNSLIIGLMAFREKEAIKKQFKSAPLTILHAC